jgi:hypothetical protein
LKKSGGPRMDDSDKVTNRWIFVGLSGILLVVGRKKQVKELEFSDKIPSSYRKNQWGRGWALRNVYEWLRRVQEFIGLS